MQIHKTGKSVCLLLTVTFFLCVFGCENTARIPERENYHVYTSYRSIPGVTEDEIAAIEDLRSRRESFTYGMNLTTETFYAPNGNIEGYSALFCNLLTILFGIPFKPEIYEWGELIDGLESYAVDFTGELTATDERRKIYFMTDAIAERTIKFMRITGGEDFADTAKTRALRYAFLEGTTTFERVSAKPDAAFETVFVNDYGTAYELLKSGDIDAFFDEGVAEAAFDGYGDVTAEDFFPRVYDPVSLTTRNPELKAVISVVQKALQNGAARHLVRLYNRGESDYLRHKLFAQLTEDEAAYTEELIAKEHPVRLAAEHDNYPNSFYNDREREWQGAAFDVLGEVSALTGLSFAPANSPGVNWSALMAMLESGEADMVTELIRSDEREGRFLWADTPYQTDNYALLSKSEYADMGINEMFYAKVGLIRDTADTEMFRTWFPNHTNTAEYDSTTEAFAALERGEVDLVMATRNQLLSLTNFQEKPGFKANIVFDRNVESLFGFSRENALLRSVVSKALLLIDTENISDRWTRRVFDYRGKMARAQIPWLIGAALLLSLLALLLPMLLRHRKEGKRLEAVMRERTAVFARRDELRQAINDAAVMLLMSDADNFGETLRAGMEKMARCVDADRVRTVKNGERDDAPAYVSEWRRAESDPQAGAEGNETPLYIKNLPEWKEKLASGLCVNGVFRNFPKAEQKYLAPCGILSVLAVPVFVRERFWGFVSFENCYEERAFSEDEESILRSGSLLLAGAVIRNESTPIIASQEKSKL
jgi:ABC-type amino acid transport substrate-binding protein